MDFGLTSEQSLLKTTARAFLERECTLDHVRAMELDELGYSPELWRTIAALGWHGIAIPEEYGGSALTFLDLALLAEEAGRVLLPGPFIPGALGGLLLALAGDAKLQEAHLPGIADGSALHVPAVIEEDSGWRPEGIRLRAAAAGNRRYIDGAKLFVPNANVSDCLHVWLKEPNDEFAVAIVRSGSEGVSITHTPTIARDHQFTVTFDGVEVDPGSVVRISPALAHRWWNMATVLECAYLLGLTERDLELTAGYARERQQFGRPIGSFQAVQHRAANMRIDVDGMRVTTYRAAWSVSQDEGEQHADVAVAKAFCSDASRRVVGNAQQIHGGIGFTRDYPAQLYFRRQKRAELAWGDGAFQRDRLADVWPARPG